MIFSPTSLAGVFVIDREPHRDARGSFARQWCAHEFAQAGLDARVAQINTAHNVVAGTLRGLHFQIGPDAESKLVSCPRGSVFDVAVDLRPTSATFCHWFGVRLDADGGRQLFIAEGCAHGYLTLEPHSDVAYQASKPYAPRSARGLRFDDPAFAILWPAPVEILSEQDSRWERFDAPTFAKDVQ